jgi:crotonobetainyl-CoA:carnitine CoA-transferase CaiB-like acyl-CoA transferase
MGERWANMDVTKEINRRIHAACADIGIEEGARRMEAEDVPFGIVLDVEEVADDPQVRHNELLVEHDHPLMGRIRQPRPAARFRGTPAVIREPSAAALGQHTNDVLAEYGWGDRIGELKDAGVIQ